jgi:2-polyprenyl-3-methyl-5-hydroxy-6-metoxy-1,4-benzoquinol methylase
MAAHDDELDELLAEQIAYYRARAPEYDATSDFGDRVRAALAEALETFAPSGDVIELACGTGQWTEVLARHATNLTAVDASAEMLALNRDRVSRSDVRYVQQDLFEWIPERRYDVVFISAWLSHVPPPRFGDFWSRVDAALADGGRVFLIDELPAVGTIEQRIGNTIAVSRTLSTGQTYRAVKVLYYPAELERLLKGLGWQARATEVSSRLFYGTAVRAP